MQFMRKINPMSAIRTNKTFRKIINAEIILAAASVIAFAAITNIIEATLANIIVFPNLHTHLVRVLLPKQGSKSKMSIITKSAAEIIAKAKITGAMLVIKPK